MPAAISVSKLSVTLSKGFRALKSVSVKLPSGKINGVIGPSGAGKTTLIRSIVGRLHFSEGEIIVFGELAGSANLRDRIGYMTQELSIYSGLTVIENLRYN
ncbi:MAG: ATP-binding cassette domain-containing protein [Candidatus Saccharimonadaceae bacterium]|nr:ATP-binding cassette domain-containing protein [Candidatus Saccharimonadaceae bacterium]